MKKWYILSGILITIVSFYFIDREIYMKKRVLRHDLWNSDDGTNRICGDFIETHGAKFKNDTMFLYRNESIHDTLVLKYQYFNTMKVMDPKTKQCGKYSMKGANWINFL